MQKIHAIKNKGSFEDWDGRFFDPTIQLVYAAFNAHGRAIAVSNISGKIQLHAHDFETGYDRQVTWKPNGALFGSISPDGEYIYYLNDTTGDEHGHFVRAAFFGGRAIDMTPDLPPYFSYTLGINDANNIFCFTASFADKNKVYIFSSENSHIHSPKCIYQSKRSISEPIMSGDGAYTCVAVSEEKKDGWSECVFIDNRTHAVHARYPFKGEITPLAFSRRENSPTVLTLSNESGNHRPVLCGLIGNNKTIINSPHFRGDVFVLLWNEEKGDLLVCDVYAANHRLFLYNLYSKKAVRVGPRTGSFDLFFGSAVFCKDKSFLVRWSDFNTPARYMKIHAPRYKKWSDAFVPSERTPTKNLIDNVWFRSTDNARVQMWMVRAKDAKKPIPFVIDIHGGPHGVASDEYNPKTQAWLANGFGYCAVNYRGSIGFGKAFEEKINGNPGHWEVEDVVAARNWLVKKGLADPLRVVVTGWSWGGYVTLLALGKHPYLWNAGIAGASIADCVMQHEDEPAFFKATDQKIFRGTPETVLKRYIKSSPTAYIRHIQAPVLILHGKNDVRCPPRQIKYFERLMREAKKNISVVWYSSGHTGNYTNIPLRVALLKKTLAFATKMTQKTPSRMKDS